MYVHFLVSLSGFPFWLPFWSLAPSSLLLSLLTATVYTVIKQHTLLLKTHAQALLGAAAAQDGGTAAAARATAVVAASGWRSLLDIHGLLLLVVALGWRALWRAVVASLLRWGTLLVVRLALVGMF